MVCSAPAYAWSDSSHQGAGGLGLNAVAVAKDMGADKVIVIDQIPGRLELARAWGRSRVKSDRTAAAGGSHSSGDGPHGRPGADVVADVVGYPQVIPERLRMLRSGGCYLGDRQYRPG